MVDTYLGTHLNTHLVTGCPFDDICRLRATVLRKGPRHPAMHVQCASVPGPMMVHCGGCNAGLRHKPSLHDRASGNSHGPIWTTHHRSPPRLISPETQLRMDLMTLMNRNMILHNRLSRCSLYECDAVAATWVHQRLSKREKYNWRARLGIR